ncbi:MAG: DUF1294 domain-containing protein [Caldilineae bacterium]|nr:DUF1294 domain-containing protein [Caldilineae bacterium]
MANRTDPRNRAYTIGAIVLGGGIFIALLLLVQLNWYIDWLVGWSISLFLLYGIDKAQAVRKGWRVPEIVLHVLALIGGFIGGWLGMFVFRHKTRKPLFKVVLAIATVIGIVLFYFFVLQR